MLTIKLTRLKLEVEWNVVDTNTKNGNIACIENKVDYKLRYI